MYDKCSALDSLKSRVLNMVLIVKLLVNEEGEGKTIRWMHVKDVKWEYSSAKSREPDLLFEISIDKT